MKRLCSLFADHARRVVKLTVLAFAFAQMASAADLYVTTNGTGNGSSWAQATNSIQGAIDAIDGTYRTNTVWVSNGVYRTGGVKGYPVGASLTNRVAIWRAITVRSANNDPTNTIIMGAWDPATNGPAAIRCVYMVNGASLIGFMLTNGATLLTGTDDLLGGGVLCQTNGANSAVISNCIIAGNSGYQGGGVGSVSISLGAGGTLYNCTLSGNAAQQYGGGAIKSKLYNCMIVNNSAAGGPSPRGCGARECILYNCTLINNFGFNGGGADGCTSYNCTIVSNSVTGTGGGAYEGTLYNCLIVSNVAGVGGGARGATLINCTIVSNFVSISDTWRGAGVYGGSLTNCILYFNTLANGTQNNYEDSKTAETIAYSCTTPAWGGVGNTASDPSLIDKANGNYRLKANSPCVNKGLNQGWMTGTLDLDGHSRLDRFSGIVDMGCYEYVPRGATFGFR